MQTVLNLTPPEVLRILHLPSRRLCSPGPQLVPLCVSQKGHSCLQDNSAQCQHRLCDLSSSWISPMSEHSPPSRVPQRILTPPSWLSHRRTVRHLRSHIPSSGTGPGMGWVPSVFLAREVPNKVAFSSLMSSWHHWGFKSQSGSILGRCPTPPFPQGSRSLWGTEGNSRPLTLCLTVVLHCQGASSMAGWGVSASSLKTRVAQPLCVLTAHLAGRMASGKSFVLCSSFLE